MKRSISSFKNLHFFKWKLLLYQNAELKKPFVKGKELFCPYTDGSKFSCLGSLTDDYKIEDYFEFFIEYHYKTLQPSYLYWKQKVNPIKTQPGDKELGFVPLSVPTYSEPFQGLARSTEYDYTFLDGTPGCKSFESWWFAIGSYYNHPDDTTIPGPTQLGVTQVYFWVRVPFGLHCTEKSNPSRTWFKLNFILIFL